MPPVFLWQLARVVSAEQADAEEDSWQAFAALVFEVW